MDYIDWIDLVYIIECYSNDYCKLKTIDNFICIKAKPLNLHMRADTVKLILKCIADQTNKYTVHKNIFPYVNTIC